MKLFTGEMKLVGVRPMPEKCWDFYPPGFKDRALRYKPGLIASIHAVDGCETFDDVVKGYAQYLDEYEKRPIATDVLYLARFLKKRILGKNLTS
jgi:lipopolysaccharide/colanic/teichoic acid biosynthesis glycosyltransferase